jgi:hypothetical protein
MDFGSVGAATVVSGGRLDVVSGGRASVIEADSGGVISLASGAVGSDMTTVFGGRIVDNGIVIYSVSNTLGAAFSGKGQVVQKTSGWLYQSGDASGFTGQVTISGGTVVLEDATGFGSAPFTFRPSGGTTATLELTAPAIPANGAAFSETLVNFLSAADALDLRDQSFVAGAKATLSGLMLSLADGGYSAKFKLSGGTAVSYLVSDDGHGGTLITPNPPAARPAIVAQCLAGFVGGGAGEGTNAHIDGLTSAVTELLKPR